MVLTLGFLHSTSSLINCALYILSACTVRRICKFLQKVTTTRRRTTTKITTTFKLLDCDAHSEKKVTVYIKTIVAVFRHRYNQPLPGHHGDLSNPVVYGSSFIPMQGDASDEEEEAGAPLTASNFSIGAKERFRSIASGSTKRGETYGGKAASVAGSDVDAEVEELTHRLRRRSLKVPLCKVDNTAY